MSSGCPDPHTMLLANQAGKAALQNYESDSLLIFHVAGKD
jgi:hypothetical protein